MANDFLNDLGETISKTAQGLGEKVGSIYENQRLRTRITSEKHIVEKALADIGRVIYEKYLNGEVLEENLHLLCDEVREHREVIESLKEDAANKKGKKICPNCKNAVDLSAAYCSFCGTRVPDPEPEDTVENAEFEDVAEAAADAMDREAEEHQEAVDAAAEDLQESGEQIKEDVAEAVDAVTEEETGSDI